MAALVRKEGSMGIFLFFVGFAVNAICGVMILIKAFKVSAGWGLAVMFIPFAGLYFVVNHWQDTKNPFLGALAGALLFVLGAIMVSGEAKEQIAQQQQSAPAPAVQEETSPPATYVSAAATPTAYQPPRSAYVPSYNPPPAPAPAPVAAVDTKTVEDEWSRKPMLEQVYVSRDTKEFYSEKCKKRPENVYRVPKSVALMQGMTEAKCR